MKRTQPAPGEPATGRGLGGLIALVAVAVVATSCIYDPTAFPNSPALSQCNGQPATMGIGYYEPDDGPNGSRYDDTAGDDVVVITNGPVTFNSSTGADVVCVNQTGIADGDGYCADAGRLGQYRVCYTAHRLADDLTFIGGDEPDQLNFYGPSNDMGRLIAQLGGGDDWVIGATGSDDTIDCGPGLDQVLYMGFEPATTDCEVVQPFSV